jgi:hypothetical protein
MNQSIVGAAAVLMLAVHGAAYADPASRPIGTTVSVQDTGSETAPAFRGQNLGVMYGGTLPSNGSEGVVQSANSLPAGFTTGTAPQVQARIEARYFAMHGPAILAGR